MNKEQLIIRVEKDFVGSKKSLQFARESLTNEQVEERRRLLKVRENRAKQGYPILLVGGILVILGSRVWFSLGSEQPSSFKQLFNLALEVFMYGCIWTLSLTFLRDVLLHFMANPDGQKVLKPVAGTRFCEDSLDCLKAGGPHVAAWRDLAIAERGQLRRYDYEMMNSLRRDYIQEQARAETRARRDAACKELHGLVEQAA